MTDPTFEYREHDLQEDLWVAIDFETATGDATSACALGLAVVERGVVRETRSWLIQPPANEYHWFCMRVHGITPEDTAQSPEFDEVWPEIAPYIESGRLLAHNAPFDGRVLRALLVKFELPKPKAALVCTVDMSRAALSHLSDHKLGTVCEACGIPLNHHEAESDAYACARVALACAEEAGTASIADAVDALGVVWRRL